MYRLITFYFQNCFIYSCQCVLLEKLQNDFENYEYMHLYHLYKYICIYVCTHTHAHTHTHIKYPIDNLTGNMINLGFPGGTRGKEPLAQKEMVTHSSILAWRTHKQRSLAGYTVHGIARVRHDLALNHHHHTHTFVYTHTCTHT